MDWNRVENNWKQLKGRAKQQWGKLTEDDLTAAHGRPDELAGKVQERYGIAMDAARKQVDEWARRADDTWLSQSPRAAARRLARRGPPQPARSVVAPVSVFEVACDGKLTRGIHLRGAFQWSRQELSIHKTHRSRRGA